jgi:hypothetical protein
MNPAPDPATHAATTAQIRDVSRAMLRGGLWPAVVVAVVAVVVSGVVAGGAGVVAALSGAVLVIVICALGPLVMGWTAQTEPLMVMGIAMISFVTKLGVLLVLFLVVDGLGLVDTRVFALALGAVTIAFIAGETIAFARTRTPTIAV